MTDEKRHIVEFQNEQHREYFVSVHQNLDEELSIVSSTLADRLAVLEEMVQASKHYSWAQDDELVYPLTQSEIEGAMVFVLLDASTSTSPNPTTSAFSGVMQSLKEAHPHDRIYDIIGIEGFDLNNKLINSLNTEQ